MIFIQDFKDREVHIVFFIGVFITSMLIFINNNNSFHTLFKSTLFLIINLIILKVYTSLKKIDLNSELKYGGLAIGDVLFLFLIIPLFSTINYCFFYISGMIFSLVLHLIIKFFDKKELVPLAGYLSLYLMIILLISKLYNVDLYSKILLNGE